MDVRSGIGQGKAGCWGMKDWSVLQARGIDRPWKDSASCSPWVPWDSATLFDHTHTALAALVVRGASRPTYHESIQIQITDLAVRPAACCTARPIPQDVKFDPSLHVKKDASRMLAITFPITNRSIKKEHA